MINMSDFSKSIPKKYQFLLLKAGISSAREVVLHSNLAFQDIGADSEDVHFLKKLASAHISSEFISVSKCMQLLDSKWNRISFGCKCLDNITNGGILTRGITDIYGESGVGKTQLLLQLSLMTQFPLSDGGVNKAVVYICTEDMFPSKRLMEFIQSFRIKYPHLNINYSKNIFIEHTLDYDKLLHCVRVRLIKLMESHEIGLIIIDSIAAIFRTNANIISRANDMRKLTQSLHFVIDKYNCGVICANQVTSISTSENSNHLDSRPCLGLAWAHRTCTRLQLLKTSKKITCDDIHRPINVRKMNVLYSPSSGNCSSDFLILRNGITDIPYSTS